MPLPPCGWIACGGVQSFSVRVLHQAQRAARLERGDPEPEAPPAEESPAGEPGHFHALLEHSRADALITMAEHFLATCDTAADYQGLKGSERCQILLHVDIHSLRRQRLSAATSCADRCQLEESQWLSPNTARRLACDASLVTVLEDGAGQVLNIGRRARTVPSAIRRALTLRDRTCRVPGCCEARYVDAHHIQHWADGGETSLENLVLLCRAHHAQLHQGRFTIRVEKSASRGESPRLVFATPGGRVIERSFFPQFNDVSAETFALALEIIAPEVDAHTLVPHWSGEDCDYGMAVDGLLRRKPAEGRVTGETGEATR